MTLTEKNVWIKLHLLDGGEETLVNLGNVLLIYEGDNGAVILNVTVDTTVDVRESVEDIKRILRQRGLL